MLNVSGIYIQFPQAHGKGEELLKLYGAVEVPIPTDPMEMRHEGYHLVVVVDNGPFEAAGTITSARDFDDFTREDGRFKRWFLVPKIHFPDTFKPSMYAEGRNGQ